MDYSSPWVGLGEAFVSIGLLNLSRSVRLRATVGADNSVHTAHKSAPRPNDSPSIDEKSFGALTSACEPFSTRKSFGIHLAPLPFRRET
jgi:hypothetical protein